MCVFITVGPTTYDKAVCPQPKYLEKVLIQNQEKSFGRSLHVPISNIWRLQLRPQPPNQEPTRHNAYVAIAGPDIDRPDLFKPAPYLTADHQISPKCLFRIRTQHTKEIPTHQHLKANLAGRQIHSKYSDRKCSFCRATPVTGHEAHYLRRSPQSWCHATLHSGKKHQVSEGGCGAKPHDFFYFFLFFSCKNHLIQVKDSQ